MGKTKARPGHVEAAVLAAVKARPPHCDILWVMALTRLSRSQAKNALGRLFNKRSIDIFKKKGQTYYAYCDHTPRGAPTNPHLDYIHPITRWGLTPPPA